VTWVAEFRELEPVVQRAPSAHNTQPWTLTYGAGHVDIGWDPAAALPVADPTRRDLFLGLGAFVETCLIAAADTGLTIAADGLRLVGAPARYDTPFTVTDIEERRCARGRYEPGPLPPVTLEPGVVRVDAGAVAPLLRRADRWMFGSAPVTAELREWLRLTPRHPRYDRDGLTDRALALSTVEATGLRMAVSRPVHAVGRRLGLPALLAAASTLDGTVFVLTGDDPVDAGRRLMRTWLALGREGVAVHPLSQLLDCPHTARAVAAMVDGTPLAIFRAGRPVTPPPRSARLPAPRAAAGPSRTSMDG
jgi:hypothetical protein